MSASKDGQPLELEPKAFDVLRHLIEHHDRIVTKDELLAAVWPDTFVTPNVLTRAIAQIRKALGDDAHEARYIETITKRGYRFIASIAAEVAASPDVEPAPPDSVPAVEPVDRVAPAPPLPPFRRAIAVVAGGLLIAVAVFLAASSVAGLRAGPGAVAPRPSSPTRVTTRSGLNVSPSLSPDGSMVAFASDRSGGLEIHVVGLARGSQEIALTRDGGQNTEPAWSPDGRWILFHSRTRGGIWIVPSTGGQPAQIVDSGSEPAWSPDGESIAYTSSQGAMVEQATIWTVRRDGSGQRALTRLGEPLGGHRSPSFSHSGRFITFSVGTGNSTRGLWVAPASGGDPWRMPQVTPWMGDPRFGPNDSALFFLGGSQTGLGLYRLPMNPADATANGTATLIASVGDGLAAGLSATARGTMAYAVTTSDANLWAVDLGPDGEAREPFRVTNLTVRAGAPIYSRDGRRVAFVQSGSGLENSAWMMNEDGSHTEPLVADGSSGNPSWGGTGSQMLITRGSTDATRSAWSIDADTKRSMTLPLPAQRMRNPRLSPDGREVAYWSLEPNGSMNTWIQRLDGSNLRRVTADKEAVNFPTWSPDGRWLAVEIKRGETTHVGVVASGGGIVEQLTDAIGQSWPHSWSPDGGEIAFAGERHGVWNIWAVSRRTRTIRPLTHFESSSGYVRYPAWSPRGNRIVFERETEEGSIWQLASP